MCFKMALKWKVGPIQLRLFAFRRACVPQKRARNTLVSSGHCLCLHMELGISSFGAISVSCSGSRTWLEQNQHEAEIIRHNLDLLKVTQWQLWDCQRAQTLA